MSKETIYAVLGSLVAVYVINHFAGNMLVAKKADGTLA